MDSYEPFEAYDFMMDDNVRDAAVQPPETILPPPADLRSEFTWIDFSTASNPLGTPREFTDAIVAAMERGEHAYLPDRDSHALRTTFSRYFNLPVESFLCGTSVDEMIRAVAQTYQPCTVGITTPGPAEYALAITNAGHMISEITSPSSFIVPDPIIARNNGIEFDAAILANPCYPTSRLLAKPTLIKYLQNCKWVILDESGIELTLGGESMIGLTRQYRNLIVIRSLCNTFAIPGIPISYCVAHPDTIAQIEQFFDNTNVSMFGEALADHILNQGAYIERARDLLEVEIPWMQCMLNLIPGVKIFPAEANYVLCSFNNEAGLDLGVRDVNDLMHRLQLSGFMVRTLQNTPGLPDNRCFCVSVRTHDENEQLITGMRKVIFGYEEEDDLL